MTDERPVDLSLYLVTDTALCGDFGVPATVKAAVDAGVTVVQLRDTTATDDDFVRLGKEMAEQLNGTGVPLIVNDRVHLVGPIGADGAHIGQGDIDPVLARKLLGPAALLGLSVQTQQHVSQAEQLDPDVVDYLGVGPIWPQATKTDAAPPVGLYGLREIVRASPWPCVAIGGITAARARALRGSGIAGIAVVSAICGRSDVPAAVQELKQAWQPGPAKK
ncbi:MAG: thiamine phosphate synthase [Nakamurella sp.]